MYSTLKMGTMKARVEVRNDYSSLACNVRHGAPCSYQYCRYTHIQYLQYVHVRVTVSMYALLRT